MAESSTRCTLEANLADEIDGDHAGLWVQFASALGVTRAELDCTPPEPETRSCVAAFEEAAANAEPAFALGMLYGYESQTPEIAVTKAAGLRDRYGISGDSLAYFELHGQLDVEHSKELAGAIADEGAMGAHNEAPTSGAQAGAFAIFGLLDRVARVCAIA